MAVFAKVGAKGSRIEVGEDEKARIKILDASPRYKRLDEPKGAEPKEPVKEAPKAKKD